MTRLLIVSNRLPVMAVAAADNVDLIETSGGVATGLRSYHEQSDCRWIGWPGDVAGFSPAQLEQLSTALVDRRVVPVLLSADEMERYYDGFCNRVLWPLFHYLVDRVPVAATGWESYRSVNERFAEAVAAVYQPGDTIWVHDYQLLLLPALLRRRLPGARIGFFLHIPFPSSEVFRILPWRQEILRGLIGADLLGFHTFAYLRHFVASLLHVEGIESQVDRVHVAGRTVRLGVFPMGVDVRAFESRAADPEVMTEVESIRRDVGGRRILLGIDRLDYTKGIPRRLLAFERLLTADPTLRDTLRYIQVAVPTRERVDSYRSFRRQVDEAVGRINGTCGTLRSTPVHYVHRTITPRELVALYCAADVMLVTPLRDGMNLVAKEFLASRIDGDGVLILSEFAGAADELGDALVVNPYDVDALVAAMTEALMMEAPVRRARMERLRRRVEEHDIHRWVTCFLAALASGGEPAVGPAEQVSPARLGRQLRGRSPVALLLDYDGSLVPLARTPELAVPDAELLAILEALSRRPGTSLHIVSGRPRDILGDWFGHLPIWLWAEHGMFRRSALRGEWTASASLPVDWMEKVHAIFAQFTTATPGSLIEQKSASLAWHYRMAEATFAARQAHELRMLLGDALSNQPLEVLEGHKLIEVRFRGITKALVAHHVLTTEQPETILAIGDDRTDDDLFAALPRSALRISVGRESGCASHRVNDYRDVRTLLGALLG